MKLWGILFTALIVLAAAKAAMAVLAVVLLVGLIYALFTCPREVFGLAGLCLVAGLIQAQPLACLGVVALLVTCHIVTAR